MARFQVQAPDGRVVTIEGDTAPTEADLDDIFASITPESLERQDSFLENALDVGGELAAGANEAAMYLPDMAVKAVNLIPGVDIPTPSEGIQSLTGFTPGQGGFMEPGVARDAVQAAGALTTAGAAMVPAVGRNLARPAEALAEFAGFGSAPVIQAGKGVSQVADSIVNPAPAQSRPIPKALQQNLDLKRGVPDVANAKVMLDEAGQTVANPRAAQAIKQGVEPGRVEQINRARPKEIETMKKMLQIKKQSLKDRTFGDTNDPVQAIGEIVTRQFNEIADTNRQAGKNIGRIARENLKNEPYAPGRAIEVFNNGLDEYGVKVVIDPQTGEKGLNFVNSRFNRTPEAQKFINNVFKNLEENPIRTGLDAHNFKQWIDDMVSYAKPGEGLKGKAENLVKNFRTAIDDQLDIMSPEYNEANTLFKQTIEALNGFGEAAGKKIDIANPKSVGNVGRRILSRAASGEPINESLKSIDALAGELGGESGQRLAPLYGYAAELDRLMGTNKANSFMGQASAAGQDVARVGKQARQGGTGLVDLGLDAAGAVYDKAQGINQENLIKALEELLSQ